MLIKFIIFIALLIVRMFKITKKEYYYMIIIINTFIILTFLIIQKNLKFLE